MEDLLVHTTDYPSDVTAIVTAMTEGERPFLLETVQVVLSDPGIGQAIVCIDEKNTWIEPTISDWLEDDRLSVIKMPMSAIGEIRNKALGYVKLPWVAYCDGDDVWCKGKTLTQRKYADETKADLVGAGHYLMTEAGKVCAYGFSVHIPMPSTWLVKTEVMKRYPFEEKVFQGSDGEWWISTGDKIRKEKCPKTLARYRVRTQSVSSASESKKRKLKLVTLASIPVFGFIIYLLSYFYWLYTRNQKYKWLSIWTVWSREVEEEKLKFREN